MIESFVKRRFYFNDKSMNRYYWISEDNIDLDEVRFIWAYNDLTTQINHDKNRIISQPIVGEDKAIRINLDHVVLIDVVELRFDVCS